MIKKLLLEIIPFTIFLIFGLLTLFKVKVPYATLITVISGLFLASVYFYASFWVFATDSLPAAVRIVAGLAYSVFIIACIFCLFHWPYWKMYSIMGYGGLAAVIVICLFNYKTPSYKPILYRCFVFVLTLSVIYGYRSFSA